MIVHEDLRPLFPESCIKVSSERTAYLQHFIALAIEVEITSVARLYNLGYSITGHERGHHGECRANGRQFRNRALALRVSEFSQVFGGTIAVPNGDLRNVLIDAHGCILSDSPHLAE
jgi:hypothetical protein